MAEKIFVYGFATSLEKALSATEAPELQRKRSYDPQDYQVVDNIILPPSVMWLHNLQIELSTEIKHAESIFIDKSATKEEKAGQLRALRRKNDCVRIMKETLLAEAAGREDLKILNDWKVGVYLSNEEYADVAADRLTNIG